MNFALVTAAQYESLTKLNTINVNLSTKLRQKEGQIRAL